MTSINSTSSSANSLKGIVVGCLTFLLCVLGTNSLRSADTRNGTEANWNNTRYLVSVRLESTDMLEFGSGHICDGSLIAPNVVLTASHCLLKYNTHKFRNASEFSIVMGNLDRTLKNNNTLKLFVNEIVTSTDFNASTYRDDIAIMILSEAVPKNYTGSSIIQMNEDRNLPVDSKCNVSGWVITKKGTYTKNVISIDLNLANKSTCATKYGWPALMNGMLCAGSANGVSDVCSGDSGAPLVCGNKLVGILSFGFGCGLSDFPSVYANVAYYAGRIRHMLAPMQTQVALPRDFSNYILYRRNTTWHSNSTHYPGSSYYPGSTYHPGTVYQPSMYTNSSHYPAGTYHPGGTIYYPPTTHYHHGGSSSVYCRNFVWIFLFVLAAFVRLL